MLCQAAVHVPEMAVQLAIYHRVVPPRVSLGTGTEAVIWVAFLQT